MNVMTSISNVQVARSNDDNYLGADRIIDTLTITAVIDNQDWAGTDDSIYVSMGHGGHTQFFCDAPRVGQVITVSIDIERMFGRPYISLAEIDNIAFVQHPQQVTTVGAVLSIWTLRAPRSHPLASDDWKLDSVLITANDIYTNTSFKHIDQWLRNASEHQQQVWSGHVNFSNWRNSDYKPVDINAQTFPIRWMPFIGDLMHWRCYDPSKIEGVGQLVGVVDGRLIGHQLKTRTSEALSPNSQGNSYTWVYTPESAIIYKRWEHSDRTGYVRHSQLGSGRPVVCAGEFRVTENHMDHVIAMVNDASGHYKPDGGACLQYVAEKFEALGVTTAYTQWEWRGADS